MPTYQLRNEEEDMSNYGEQIERLVRENEHLKLDISRLTRENERLASQLEIFGKRKDKAAQSKGEEQN